MMATVFISWEFRKGVHSSGVLWIFWLTQVTFDILALRSHVLRMSNDVRVLLDLLSNFGRFLFSMHIVHICRIKG